MACLLENKANVDHCDRVRTALFFKRSSFTLVFPLQRGTTLCMHAGRNNKKEMVSLLIAAGANVNAKDKVRTSICELMYLRFKNPPLCLLCKDGRSALRDCVEEGNHECLEALLKASGIPDERNEVQASMPVCETAVAHHSPTLVWLKTEFMFLRGTKGTNRMSSSPP
jgi:ankyrin repeat protein